MKNTDKFMVISRRWKFFFLKICVFMRKAIFGHLNFESCKIWFLNSINLMLWREKASAIRKREIIQILLFGWNHLIFSADNHLIFSADNHLIAPQKTTLYQNFKMGTFSHFLDPIQSLWNYFLPSSLNPQSHLSLKKSNPN